MPVTHVNRREDTYYLHAGTTRTGKPRYWFSRIAEGDLVEAIPEGYEVYDGPTTTGASLKPWRMNTNVGRFRRRRIKRLVGSR